MKWILRYKMHYVVFGAVFLLCWFLFKVGGIPNIKRALTSASVDVFVSMAALLITVEVLLPKFIYRHKYGRFFLYFFLLVFACGTTIILTQLNLDNTSITQYKANVLRSPKHFYYWFWADLVFGSYILVFFISATGAGVQFAFERLRALNMVEKLEKEKLTAQLDLLKNQVNPHFLFNALNTIFYKIDRTNQPARETLERFSKMLRYQLYECNTEYIAIEKELEFLASYIELQKERLNENYTITCNGFDEVKGLVISPFLLMPVVENCFKHVSKSIGKENIISIDCNAAGNIFTLHTCNTSEENSSSKKGGIGLDNMQKRLQLVYPNKYVLTMQQHDGMFELSLKLHWHEIALYYNRR